MAFQSLDVNAVLEKMDNARNRSNFVILDACRNNPFAKAFRLACQGLAPMDAPPGTLIAFATAPGSVAADGTGRNGLYTEALLAQMQVRGLKVEDVFKRARAAVRKASGGQQVPWENTSLEGDFRFLAPSPSAKPGGAAPMVTFASSSAGAPRRAERPDLAVGDRWLYRRIDGLAGTARFEIASIEGEVRTAVGDRFDTDWAVLFIKNDGLTYEPRVPRLPWPMVPGAESKFEYRVLGSKDYPEWTVTGMMRVVGREQVTVPAGTFDTFKIEVSGRYRQKRADGRGGSGFFKNVYWYAPDVKREVFREHETSKWDGVIESRGRFALFDYSVR